MKNIVKNILLSVLLVMVTIVVTYVSHFSEGKECTSCYAQKGILNLESWNWSESKIIKLDGEWEYYPNLLIDELNSETTSIVKRIPHFWEEDFDLNYTPYGVGTYKLKITGLKPLGIYGFEILDEVTAYKLFVNNVLVASNGIVSKERCTYFPQWHPVQGVFQVDKGGKAEFNMEISNFDYYRGGFWNSIKIGNLENIFSAVNHSKLLDMFLFTSIFVMGFFSFIFFFLYKRRDKATLFFAIFCFCMSIRILLTGQRLISEIIPILNWYTLVRLEYFFGYLLLPIFGMFVINLYDNYPYAILQKRLFKLIILSCFVITMFMPNTVYTAFLEPYKWLSMIFILLFIYFITKSIIQKSKSAKLMLFAALGMIISVLKEVFIGGTISWMPLATLNFTFCFSLITFQQFLSIIHENEILGTKVIMDPLTGLFNRTYLMELKEDNQFFKYGNPKKHVMFLDLDCFKKVNDTYGHKIGDYVLQETGRRLKTLLRNTDIICRYGGDEFIIIVDGSLEETKNIAERIIQRIQEPFEKDGNVYNINVSIGITEIDNKIINIEAAIRHSDQAMYEAKKYGGGQYYIKNFT